jgi:hypothetical protein
MLLRLEGIARLFDVALCHCFISGAKRPLHRIFEEIVPRLAARFPQAAFRCFRYSGDMKKGVLKHGSVDV